MSQVVNTMKVPGLGLREKTVSSRTLPIEYLTAGRPKTRRARSSAKRSPPQATRHRQPPSLLSTVKLSHRFRWVNSNPSNPVSETFSNVDMCQFLTSKIGGSTTTTPIISSARLKSVELFTSWSSATSSPPSGDVPRIFFAEDSQSPQETKSDSNLGQADVGYARLVPPKNSQAGFWVSDASTSANLFNVYIPAGYSAVLDVVIEATLSDQNHATTGFVGTSGSSTSLGQFAPSNLSPVGYQAN